MNLPKILFSLLVVGIIGCDSGEEGSQQLGESGTSGEQEVAAQARQQDDNAPAGGNNNGQEEPMGCDAGKAEWMIGQKPTDELLERGAADAGAEVARYLRHDQVVTMEYHPSRLNAKLNEQGIIYDVRCG